MLPFKANITLISGSFLDISPLSLMPWNVAIQGKHHTDIRKLSRYQSVISISDALKCCCQGKHHTDIRKLSGYQSTISDALKCCHSRQTSHWYQEAIWISVHCLWCLEMLPWMSIQVKHHTDIRKLSGYQSTIFYALKCWHSRQTSHLYQEAIWISVHCLLCLEMLTFKTNISHTDIRKLSGYQSTVFYALKCCHSRQTSHWYQEAI